MSETTTTLNFATSDEAVDLARAEVYGLLSALLIRAPEPSLLEALRVAPTQAPEAGAFLENAWTDVVGAAQRLSNEAIHREYEQLFVAVGKPEVWLQGSFYLAGALHEKPLAALRTALNDLGLERPPEVVDTEDHISALCEVMRYLIAGDDPIRGSLPNQAAFFNAHMRPWVDALFDAMAAHERADFYRALGRFAHDFMAVEGQGLDMVDA